MLKNAHIVIYPINKKGELNVVCIIRQKLSNNIDLKALIKKEIIPQNKNLESLFENKLEYWPIYTSKKPSKSIYENLFYIGDAFLLFLLLWPRAPLSQLRLLMNYLIFYLKIINIPQIFFSKKG